MTRAMSATASRSASERTVSQIMTSDLVTLKLTDTLRLAHDIMSLAHVRHFPVVDGGKPAGVIHQLDLLRASLASLVRHPKDTPREALGAIAVKDVMKPATTVKKETTISHAARTMIDEDLECLLVMESSRLVGLVSRTDLLRELAKPMKRG